MFIKTLVFGNVYLPTTTIFENELSDLDTKYNDIKQELEERRINNLIDGNQYDYYKDIDGAVIIGAVVADTEELIIPSQLNGLDVIGLNTKSFYGYNSNNHNITKKTFVSR